MHTENYKTSLKEIKDLGKWKDINFHRLGDNIVKMVIIATLIYRFNIIPIKVSAVFFAEADNVIVTLIWKFK